MAAVNKKCVNVIDVLFRSSTLAGFKGGLASEGLILVVRSPKYMEPKDSPLKG